jgi:hypothetical protein
MSISKIPSVGSKSVKSLGSDTLDAESAEVTRPLAPDLQCALVVTNPPLRKCCLCYRESPRKTRMGSHVSVSLAPEDAATT